LHVISVYDALVLHKVKALTKIYSVISLPEIASKVGLGICESETVKEPVEVVERAIVALALKGEISVRIDQVAGVAHFTSASPTAATSSDSTLRLQVERALQENNELSDRLRGLQTQAMTSAAYLYRTSAAASSPPSLMKGGHH